MIFLNLEAASINELKQKALEALGLTEQPSLQPTVDLYPGAPGQETAKASVLAESEPKTEKETPEQEPAKTYDLVAVRAAANAYKDKHGIEKLREIFKKHGGEKLKDIPEKNYAALMKEIA